MFLYSIQIYVQEENEARHSKRILSGSVRLKDIKNEINQARSDMNRSLINVQENNQVIQISLIIILRYIHTLLFI